MSIAQDLLSTRFRVSQLKVRRSHETPLQIFIRVDSFGARATNAGPFGKFLGHLSTRFQMSQPKVRRSHETPLQVFIRVDSCD
jgi:hypothetical protein